MGETSAENAMFWLPSHFLADDDDLLAVRRKAAAQEPPPKKFDLFSGGFDPFGSLSPVSSTEGEPLERDNNDDDDDFLAELTRHLAHSSLHDSSDKPWMFSTSPQSTLSGFSQWSNGPSQVPSPPVSPPGGKDDAAWDLLYEAAGQVARLKINAMAAQLNHHHHHHQVQQQQQNRGLLGNNPRNVSLPSCKPNHLNNLYNNQFQGVKRQGSGTMWAPGQQHHHSNHQQRAERGGTLGLPTSAWPPLRSQQEREKCFCHHQHQHQHQHQSHHQHGHRLNGVSPASSTMRAVFLGGVGAGVKRQSAGTGVFLPRRFGNTQQQQQPEPPRKKPSACSTVLLPARVVQALNLDLDEVNNGLNLNSQSRFGNGFPNDHDVLMGRRNAVLGQQRRNMGMRADGGATMGMGGHEVRLPSDWIY